MHSSFGHLMLFSVSVMCGMADASGYWCKAAALPLHSLQLRLPF